MKNAAFAIVAIAAVAVAAPAAGALKLRHVLALYGEGGAKMKHPGSVACDQRSAVVVADTGNGRLLRYAVEDGKVKTVEELKPQGLASPQRVQMNSRAEIFVLDGRQRKILRLGPAGEFKGYLEPEGLPFPPAWIPKSFAIGADDGIYILDIFSNRVIIVDREGKYQRHLRLPEGEGFMSDLAVDSRGTVYLVDSVRAVVYAAAPESKDFSPLTKSLKEYVDFPAALAVDGRNLYVVDRNGGTIAVLGRDGSFRGRALKAGWKEDEVRYPSDICLNGTGSLIVVDRGNNRVQIFMIAE